MTLLFLSLPDGERVGKSGFHGLQCSVTKLKEFGKSRSFITGLRSPFPTPQFALLQKRNNAVHQRRHREVEE